MEWQLRLQTFRSDHATATFQPQCLSLGLLSLHVSAHFQTKKSMQTHWNACSADASEIRTQQAALSLSFLKSVGRLLVLPALLAERLMQVRKQIRIQQWHSKTSTADLANSSQTGKLARNHHGEPAVLRGTVLLTLVAAVTQAGSCTVVRAR